ncbi:MAG: hypothetical protein HY558_08550 [Euryarchaeota archaeon]|nr:hypothetical protein [Euryarchaeota archaeon]
MSGGPPGERTAAAPGAPGKGRLLARAFLAGALSGVPVGLPFALALSPLLSWLALLALGVFMVVGVFSGPLFHLLRPLRPRPVRGAVAGALFWSLVVGLLLDPVSAPAGLVLGAAGGAPAALVLLKPAENAPGFKPGDESAGDFNLPWLVAGRSRRRRRAQHTKTPRPPGRGDSRR